MMRNTMEKIVFESKNYNSKTRPFFVSSSSSSTFSTTTKRDDHGRDDPNDGLSKIGASSQECQSVYRKFKFFAVIGCLTGIFPVQNCFTGKSSNQLVFKKFSLIYLYSWLLLPTKLFMLVVGTFCYFVYYWADIHNHSKLDQAALASVYIFTFCFGIIAHILNINRSGSLLKLFQKLDTYDDKYPCRIPTPILSRKVVTCLIANLLVVNFPMVITANSFHRRKNRPQGLTLWLGFTYTNNLALVLIISTCGMWFIEFAAGFYYIVLYYLAAMFTHRLKNIVKNVQDKSVSTKEVMGNLFLDEEDIAAGRGRRKSLMKKKQQIEKHDGMDWNWKYSCYRSQKSWTLISQQYLDFSDVLGQFCEFSGSAFIFLYLTLMMTLVCMLFYYLSASGGSTDFIDECGPTLIAIVCIGFCRILHLSDIGENLEKAHALLLQSLLRVQQEQDVQFLSEEKNQFKGLKTLVRTIPIVVSAKGYFTVNRKNVTSVLSVIITYIIVLVQFRMSTNDTASSGGNCSLKQPPPKNLTDAE